MTIAAIGYTYLVILSLGIQGGQSPTDTAAIKSRYVPTALQKDGSVVFGTNGLRVDTDGAPNSYRVDDKGLSYICDGVAAIIGGRALTTRDKNWQPQCRTAWANAQLTGNYKPLDIFGFSHDPVTNAPIRQRDGDPFPEVAFRTETTLHVAGAAQDTQSQYVDATKIPYVVLPKYFEEKFGAEPGDLVMLYRPSNGAIAFAVFGDIGGVGEGSVKLHFDLGGTPIACVNGVNRGSENIEDKVWTVVFPHVRVETGLDPVAWNMRIYQTGEKALRDWGGTPRLKDIAGGNPSLRAVKSPGPHNLSPCDTVNSQSTPKRVKSDHN